MSQKKEPPQGMKIERKQGGVWNARRLVVRLTTWGGRTVVDEKKETEATCGNACRLVVNFLWGGEPSLIEKKERKQGGVWDAHRVVNHFAVEGGGRENC